jgi:N6-adenosine-specific RNA methylase IME4
MRQNLGTFQKRNIKSFIPIGRFWVSKEKYRMEKFKIIYADPPWNFKTYSDRWQEENKHSRWTGNKYPLMDIEDICELPIIPQIRDDDCILFMWVTFPTLPDALRVIEAWGFKYKTNAFTWIKTNKKNQESLFWGCGYWTRSNSEICLLATRGKPERISARVHSVVQSPVERHSKKPDEVRKRIVKLCGDLPRIELFAREKVDGWDCWGNEVNQNDDVIFNRLSCTPRNDDSVLPRFNPVLCYANN